MPHRAGSKVSNGGYEHLTNVNVIPAPFWISIDSFSVLFKTALNLNTNKIDIVIPAWWALIVIFDNVDDKYIGSFPVENLARW